MPTQKSSVHAILYERMHPWNGYDRRHCAVFAAPLYAGLYLSLAVVVGKLFLLDLANSGTVARIVSFLGVGGLLMIIGYVAPVPPGDIGQRVEIIGRANAG